jgi:hypothetical protein
LDDDDKRERVLYPGILFLFPQKSRTLVVRAKDGSTKSLNKMLIKRGSYLRPWHCLSHG